MTVHIKIAKRHRCIKDIFRREVKVRHSPHDSTLVRNNFFICRRVPSDCSRQFCFFLEKVQQSACVKLMHNKCIRRIKSERVRLELSSKLGTCGQNLDWHQTGGGAN